MVERSLSNIPEKIIGRIGNVQLAVERILTGKIPSFILDDQILVCYAVDSPWYTDKILVSELMVLRLKDGTTNLSDVDDLLTDIMHMADACGITTGGALSDRPRALARRYKQLGYSEEDTPTLIKWR